MNTIFSRKTLVIGALVVATFAAQSFIQKEQHHEKPQNLKILPKDISGEELHKVMREYSMSLGVHCNFCHESQKVEGQERPKYDFASDKKEEKEIARDMMKMTEALNKKYMSKIQDGKLRPVTCVTCHNGSIHPINSVDSLKKM